MLEEESGEPTLIQRLESGDESPLLVEVSGRTTVLVVFGGLGNGMAMPPFEFFGLTSGLDIDRIFVRDASRGFYHRGVAGLGRSPSEIARAIEPHLVDAQHIVTVGVSAGGYAVLLFGSLLGADQVLAFSPQTCLRWLPRAVRYDRFVHEDIDRARKDSIEPDQLDLRRFLAAHPVASADIHYAVDNRIDAWHAQRIRSETVRTFGHTGASHLLAKELRASGELTTLLTDLVSPPTTGRAAGADSGEAVPECPSPAWRSVLSNVVERTLEPFR